MAPPSIKLIYFDTKGRGEIPRLVLAQAGVDFEDKRITKDEWKELKPTMPTGQVPALEYNGRLLCQSMTIARFVAREFHLAGKDNWEMAQADMVVDCISDLSQNFMGAVTEKDEEKKKVMMKDFESDHFTPFTRKLETILAENGGGPFVVGKELTWADICVAHVLASFEGYSGSSDWRAGAPKVASLVDKVLNMPRIKAWIEQRPSQ